MIPIAPCNWITNLGAEVGRTGPVRRERPSAGRAGPPYRRYRAKVKKPGATGLQAVFPLLANRHIRGSLCVP